jgi:hypothetical protein
MSDLYLNLSLRYRNKIRLIDDNELKGIILFNDKVSDVKKMFVQFKYSKKSLINEETTFIKRGFEGFKSTKKTYKVCIIEFVKYALTKGYDWKLYGQPEWEAIEPTKKKKFINPRKKKRQ